ncbi:MAG TPA: chlorophyllase [Micromonosporaceae bacterium]
MRRALAALAATLALVSGCTAATTPARWHPAPMASGQVVAPRETTLPPRAGAAPTRPLPVAVRTLTVTNGPDRVLPTTVWYPTATGRFPVVVFSHGLTGLPTDYAALLARWATAGFVVAAPAYPHTSRGVARFDITDVLNQPADASAVLTAVLDDAALRDRVDPAHVAAAGHSAGAITTVGLFTGARDPRLSAGVVLAGNALGFGTRYTGPPAALLFVHGDRDGVVSYASGKAAFAAAPWPKAFLSVPGGGHTDPYIRPGTTGYATVAATTTDFLRWALYGDRAAYRRLAATGSIDDEL